MKFKKKTSFGLAVVICIGLYNPLIYNPKGRIRTFSFIASFIHFKSMTNQTMKVQNEYRQSQRNLLKEVQEIKEIISTPNSCQDHHEKLIRKVKLQKPTGNDNRHYFKTITHHQDREILRDLLEKFVQVATKHNIIFFMYAGTLIGSYRHHGLIPWDDDIDFLIPASQRDYVSKLLSNLGPNYKVILQEKLVSKFFLRSSRPVPGQAWNYPYIDLYFYKERKHFIHFLGKIDKSLVFPLGKRPFWNFTLPSPKNTEGFIRLNAKSFDTDCLTQSITHRDAKRVKVWREKCHKLWDKFPFVFRCNTNSGVNESLWIGDQLVSWKVIH